MRRLDYKRQLIDYFKRNLSKKYDSESLKFALIQQGYSRVAVEEAYKKATEELAEKAPKLKEKPIIKYELYDKNNKRVNLKPLKFWDKVKYFFKGRNLK
jgi:hypothetical protein